MIAPRALALSLMVTITAALPAQQTVPERTAMQRTSTHREVLAFLDSLQARGAGIQVGTLGLSPRGLSIPYVIAAR
ncbi:MAG: hypothetical protein CVV17_00540, partial [Gammaproteobacteria bacterium HGW-Gammaproteobacteria-7]